MHRRTRMVSTNLAVLDLGIMTNMALGTFVRPPILGT